MYLIQNLDVSVNLNDTVCLFSQAEIYMPRLFQLFNYVFFKSVVMATFILCYKHDHIFFGIFAICKNNPIKHVHLAFKFIIPVPISQIKHGVTKTLNLLIKLKKSFSCFVLIYQEGVHET